MNLQPRYNDDDIKPWDQTEDDLTSVTTKATVTKSETPIDKKASKQQQPQYRTQKKQEQKPKKKKLPSSLPENSSKPKVNNFAPPTASNTQFYERFIRNTQTLDQQYQQGQMIKGRIYLTKDEKDGQTPVGYVKCEGLPQAVKVWGLKNLNRSWEMDEVWLRFVQWKEWGKASDKRLQGINFEKHTEYQEGEKEETQKEEEEAGEEEAEQAEENEEAGQDEAGDDGDNEENQEEEEKVEGQNDENNEKEAEDVEQGKEEEEGEEYGEEEGEEYGDDYYGEDYYGEDYDKEEEGDEADDAEKEEVDAEDKEEDEEDYYDEEEEGGGDEEDDDEESEEEEEEADDEEEEDEEQKDEAIEVKPEMVLEYVETVKDEESTVATPTVEITLGSSESKVTTEKAKPKKAVVQLITKAPSAFTSRADLLAFLDTYSALRPLAKVVAITDSILKRQIFSGLMSRKRIGKKEDNKWRQIITPDADCQALFKNVKSFLVDDPKIKETQPRQVTFKVVGWREKWPLARIVA